jgi:putative peptidoglycan lipid II flippase
LLFVKDNFIVALVKNTLTVSGLTLLSRIFGVIRDALIAMVIGTTAQSDAFFIAFRPFDLLRKMFGDGIFSIAFVPPFSGYIETGRRDQAIAMVASGLTVLSALGVFLVLAGLLLAPWILPFMAPGFEPGGEKFSMTLVLFRIMMPYIWIIMVISLCMGILNTLGNFHVPGATPLVFNLVVILFTLLAPRFADVPVTGIAFGVVFGGVLQLALQLPFMIRHGMIRPARFIWRHPGVTASMKKMIPCMVGAAPYQVNILVISLFASFLADGSVSYLYYADRLVQFPVALIAVSFSMVLLPYFSKKAAAGALAQIAEVFGTGIRLVVVVAIPAMAGLMVLNDPIVTLLFGQGAFDSQAAARTAGCLFYLAMGLWAFIGSRVLVTLHYAVDSIWYPFFAGIISVATNLVCAPLLMSAMGVKGLALSVSVSAVAGFAFLICYPPAGIRFSRSDMMVSACRALFLSAIMVAFIKWVGRFVLFETSGKLVLGAGVMTCVALGVAVTFLTAKVLQMPEIDMVWQWFKTHTRQMESHGKG